MARGKRHSDEKRAAVIAALLAGQGVSEVARKYKLDPSVVCRWKARIAPGELQRVANQNAHEFDELLTNAIVAILRLVEFSAKLPFTQEGLAWIRQYSPSDFAVYCGVLTDKGFRLLEAAGAAREAESEREVEAAAPAPHPVHLKLLR